MVAGFSNFEAGRAAGQYLLAKGWRKLCFAGGPGDRSAARLEGFCSAVEQVRGGNAQD